MGPASTCTGEYGAEGFGWCDARLPEPELMLQPDKAPMQALYIFEAEAAADDGDMWDVGV